MEEGKNAGNSDGSAINQCIEWLREQGYKDPHKSNHPTDIECEDKNGKKINVEVKMTTKEKYFGAATLTEWVTVLDKDAELKFVVAKLITTTSAEKKYDFYWIDTEKFYEISTVPPFKVNFNIKEEEFQKNEHCCNTIQFKDRKPRKDTVVLTKDLVGLLGDIYSLLKDDKSLKLLHEAVKEIKVKQKIN